MNCSDSWRHISDIVKLERCWTGAKQTFCQICLSLHYQIYRWITAILILHHPKGKQTICFTPHTCSTLATVFNLHWFVSVAKLHVSSSFLFALMSCFNLETFTYSQTKLDPIEGSEQEVEVVKGKNRRERGKPISSWVVMVMWGCQGGRGWWFSVDCRRSTSDRLRLLLCCSPNTQLREPLCPRNTTLWRWSPTPLNYCIHV